jgi:hypothetical protein
LWTIVIQGASGSVTSSGVAVDAERSVSAGAPSAHR